MANVDTRKDGDDASVDRTGHDKEFQKKLQALFDQLTDDPESQLDNLAAQADLGSMMSSPNIFGMVLESFDKLTPVQRLGIVKAMSYNRIDGADEFLCGLAAKSSEDMNVRVAAIESLGLRNAYDLTTIKDLLKRLQDDPIASVCSKAQEWLRLVTE